MYQNIPTKVLTGRVRLSYCHLTEPHSSNGGELKYSVTLLIPKSDTATKADIDSSIMAAFEAGVRSKWNGARPQLRNTLIYDGDGVRQNGEAFDEECKGHWVITASSRNKPEVVHISNIHAQLAPSDIYSGMYARVTMNFFPYDSGGSKGVGCGLGNVLKLEDGEPLSGRSSAASDFEGLGGGAHQQMPPYGDTNTSAQAQQTYRQQAVPQPYQAPVQGTWEPQQYQAPAQGYDPILGL